MCIISLIKNNISLWLILCFSPFFLFSMEKNDTLESQTYLPLCYTEQNCSIPYKIHFLATLNTEDKKALLAHSFRFFDQKNKGWNWNNAFSYAVTRYNENGDQISIDCLSNQIFPLLMTPLHLENNYEQLRYFTDLIKNDCEHTLVMLWSDYLALGLKDESSLHSLRLALLLYTDIQGECTADIHAHDSPSDRLKNVNTDENDEYILIPDPFTQSNCLVNKHTLQKFLHSSQHSLALACIGMKISKAGILDLNFRNIHSVDTHEDKFSFNPYQVKEIILNYTPIQRTFLKELRRLFPHVTTIHLKGCPLEYTPSDTPLYYTLNRLYSNRHPLLYQLKQLCAHVTSISFKKGTDDDVLYKNALFEEDLLYLKSSNPSDNTCAPLTLHLSKDVNSVIKKLLYYYAAPDYYRYYVKKAIYGILSVTFALLTAGTAHKSFAFSTALAHLCYARNMQRTDIIIALMLTSFNGIMAAYAQIWLLAQGRAAYTAMNNLIPPSVPTIVFEE